MSKANVLLGLLTVLPCLACASLDDREKGPPLPLHTIDGTSGHFSVPSAYVTNPAPEGQVFGYPSVGATNVNLGHGKALAAVTVTETLWDRVELGYGFDNFNVGDTYEAIGDATGTRPDGHYIQLHNFTAKVMAIKEGGFDLSWMPAITLGATYKYNDSWSDLNSDLTPPGLAAICGVEDDDGVDVTLFASKMLTFIPRPVILTLGLRSTEAAHIGLLGFTGDRKINFEGAIVYMPVDRAFLAGEYKQKQCSYNEVPSLVGSEDDWWVLAAGYILSPHSTIALGYGHFGKLLNTEANSSLGLAFKYEF